jgi:Ni,Fe-hydrogenase III component G
MNILPGVTEIVAEVQERFGDRFDAVRADRPNEIYFHAQMELVAGFTAHLYKIWDARLVSLFADDAREQEKRVPPLLRVCARRGARVFHPARAGAADAAGVHLADQRHCPPSTGRSGKFRTCSACNSIGHPNPAAARLHDDWPEVYPLRKDFDLHTVLPPFTGERHKFREVEGEGVFQVPVGPVHAGIIEPGHFLFSVAGEPVLYLQLRLFYTHKGTEKLFENMPVTHGVRLAESISGDSSFAHATAFAMPSSAPRTWRRRRARARCAPLPGVGTPLQPHRRHRRDCDRRGVCGGQHARHAAQGTRAARQ